MQQKPPYKPLTQLPHCCCPACLIMILDRRRLAHSTQEDIGNQLGLIISPQNAPLFKKATVGKAADKEYGTQTHKKEYSINNFFLKNHIKLKEKHYPVEKMKDPSVFIIKNLRLGNDIMVCINNKILYGEGHGHLSLIQAIKGDEITLIDPKIDQPKVRIVKLEKLLESMKRKYHQKRKRGGFWIISEL